MIINYLLITILVINNIDRNGKNSGLAAFFFSHCADYLTTTIAQP